MFNTEFEVSLRLLLFLDCLSDGTSVDRAAALDFISVYGREFNVTKTNLHGDNFLAFSEFPARRQEIRAALKSMVLDGWAVVQDTGFGFVYGITPKAKDAAAQLKDEYPTAYRNAVKAAVERFGSLKEEQLLEIISQATTKSLRR